MANDIRECNWLFNKREEISELLETNRTINDGLPKFDILKF